MNRRRRKRQLIPTVWLDWTPEIARLFRLVPDDWAPPSKVRICGSVRRRTVSARFRSPSGQASVARVRLERGPDQLCDVADETLSVQIGGPA